MGGNQQHFSADEIGASSPCGVFVIGVRFYNYQRILIIGVRVFLHSAVKVMFADWFQGEDVAADRSG